MVSLGLSRAAVAATDVESSPPLSITPTGWPAGRRRSTAESNVSRSSAAYASGEPSSTIRSGSRVQYRRRRSPSASSQAQWPGGSVVTPADEGPLGVRLERQPLGHPHAVEFVTYTVERAHRQCGRSERRHSAALMDLQRAHADLVAGDQHATAARIGHRERELAAEMVQATFAPARVGGEDELRIGSKLPAIRRGRFELGSTVEGGVGHEPERAVRGAHRLIERGRRAGLGRLAGSEGHADPSDASRPRALRVPSERAEGAQHADEIPCGERSPVGSDYPADCAHGGGTLPGGEGLIA